MWQSKENYVFTGMELGSATREAPVRLIDYVVLTLYEGGYADVMSDNCFSLILDFIK